MADTPQPDIRGLISDPEFKALPPERKKAVLERAGAEPSFIAEYLRLPEAAPQASLGPEGVPGDATDPLRGAAGAETIGEAPWYARRFNTAGPARAVAEAIRPGSGADIQGLDLPSLTEVLSAAPSVGGAIGGIVGGSPALVPGGGALAAATGAGGAALGGATGELVRQVGMRALGGDAPEESGREVVAAGLKQGAAELGGRGLAGGLNRVLAPGAGAVDATVLEAAERRGVEMPASAVTDSRLARFVEEQASGGLGGGKIAKRYVEVTGRLTEMADHTVARASKLTDDGARGEAMAKGLEAYKDAWIQTKGRIFGEAKKERVGLRMALPRGVKLLEAVVAQKQGARRIMPSGPVEDQWYAQTLDALSTKVKRGGQTTRVPKVVAAEDVNAALQELNERIAGSFADPFAAANKGTLQKLSATLDEEFVDGLRRQAPKAADKLEAAREVYKEGLSKINSTFGDSIHNLAREGKYDLIAKSVANARMSAADIPRIMEVAGEEGADAMRASVLADLVARGKTGVGLEARITPKGLNTAVKTFGETKLRAILTPEQWSMIRDVGTMSAALERGNVGSRTAHLQNVSMLKTGARRILEAGVGGGAATGHPTAALGFMTLLLGDTAMNKFIASKAGQRWLTTGYPLSGPVRQGLRQAPRAGVAAWDASQQRERDRQAAEER